MVKETKDDDVNENIDSDNGESEVNAQEDSEQKDSDIDNSEASGDEADKKVEEPEKKISFTQDEFDKKIRREKAVAERRAIREYEEKKTSEKAATSAAVYNQPAAPAHGAAPSPDHFYDEAVGWIDKNLTLEQFSQMYGGQEAQPAQQATSNVQPANSTPPEVPITKEARNQLDELIVDEPMSQAILAYAYNNKGLTPEMVSAAALAPDGVKALYELIKTDPERVVNISRLEPAYQQASIGQYNSERAEKTTPPKVVTQISPKAQPLKNDGVNTKSEGSGDYLARKRARFEAD